MLRKNGFSIIELLVILAVLGIATTIAVPGFSILLPNYRLKTAARDLYSNMQLAKMGAIKSNADWAVVFDHGLNSYSICSDDGGDGDWTDGDETVEKTVNMSDYGSGVGYGHGNATTNATSGGGAFPVDDISYAGPNNVAIFNSRGLIDNLGYVYLSNSKNTSYALGTPSVAGVIVMRKWAGAAWE
jgi:type IV fimbrial biogenesis protein FimT